MSAVALTGTGPGAVTCLVGPCPDFHGHGPGPAGGSPAPAALRTPGVCGGRVKIEHDIVQPGRVSGDSASGSASELNGINSSWAHWQPGTGRNPAPAVTILFEHTQLTPCRRSVTSPSLRVQVAVAIIFTEVVFELRRSAGPECHGIVTVPGPATRISSTESD